MKMKLRRFRSVLWGNVLCALALGLENARATERYFTYSYEPETMVKGAMEFEQWVTLRTQRNQAAGAGGDGQRPSRALRAGAQLSEVLLVAAQELPIQFRCDETCRRSCR